MLGYTSSLPGEWAKLFYSSPVIDVSPGVDIPALDGCPHPLYNFLSVGLTYTPNLWTIKHDMGEHTTGIIGYLNAICFALQQVAAKREEIT